jgi:hypothetical protein
VQPPAFLPEQLLGDGLPNEGVPERELVLARLDEHPRRNQLAQRGDQLVLAHIRDHSKQVELEAVPEDRGRLQDLLRLRSDLSSWR